MSRTFICSVGTSLLDNAKENGVNSASLEGLATDAIDSQPAKKILNQLKKDLIEKADTDAKRRKMSAELKSLLLFKPDITSQDRIVLLHSDNPKGLVSAEGIKQALIVYIGFKKDDIKVERVRGLQVDNFERFRTDGVRNLISLVIKELESFGLAGENPDPYWASNVTLNPTGGYKASLPYLTLLGALFGVKVIYIFEDSDNLLTLPPVPVNYDIALMRKAHPLLSILAENEGKNMVEIEKLSEEVCQLLLELESRDDFVNVLVEKVDNLLSFTALGWMFYKRFNQDYRRELRKTHLKPEEKQFNLTTKPHHDNSDVKAAWARLKKSDYVEAFLHGDKGRPDRAGIRKVGPNGELTLNLGNVLDTRITIKTTGDDEQQIREIGQILMEQGYLD